MNFDRLFRILSYAAVFCGFAALWVSGTFGPLESFAFIGVVAAAWFLEGTRFQITEYIGTAMIVLALPLFYVLWKYGFFSFANHETVLPGILARLILTLTAIKLLQKKSDRDWMFLYLMSFFELLLAAGLSISALYLCTFIAYTFLMVCSIILFEMKKASAASQEGSTLKAEPVLTSTVPIRRLNSTAALLMIFVILLAVPIFFMLPRVGSAGIGGGQGGVNTSTGFSDTVRLGGIGTIQQNDAIVMRARFDDPGFTPPQIRWRGIALDTFDNLSWKRSQPARQTVLKDERELIQVGHASDRADIFTQTVYLEPLDSPFIFGLSRIVAVQGNFPVLFRDEQDSLTHHSRGERITYKVYSDISRPAEAVLRADQTPYSSAYANYRALPAIDPRIGELAGQIISGTDNRYDAAMQMEAYLQTSFGYTLEMKAGGSEPLADFLFNVREGHCEYFATAMAVMLRTQGIATRVVNGFSRGEYNDTADVWVVRQRNAHSWVEVYFPDENAWVQFDPTPFVGQDGAPVGDGIAASFNRYLEALETFWIQYVVAFDDREQRTLMASVRRTFQDYRTSAAAFTSKLRASAYEWWTEIRGDKGTMTSVYALGTGAGIIAGILVLGFAIFRLYKKVSGVGIWKRLRKRFFSASKPSIVEFYDRLQRILAGKGFTREPHQTPLEFASAVEIPEAVFITEKYNRVRFGDKELSDAEAREIEGFLTVIDSSE